MAFFIHSIDHGANLSTEYMPCGAITPKAGMALTMTGGRLAVAAGETAPTYISLVDRDAACTAGDIIPVARVNSGTVFETSFSAAAGSVKPGDRVTVAAGGMQVTATTAGGVAEVVYMDGTASGSMCRVRF